MVCQGWDVIWGIPPEPTFRLEETKEISYVTYRFYCGHDGGIPAGRATDRSDSSGKQFSVVPTMRTIIRS